MTRLLYATEPPDFVTASKPTPALPPVPAPLALSLSQALAGRGVAFRVGDHHFVIRQPTPDEYDDAIWTYRVARRLALAQAQQMGLSALDVPPPDLAAAVATLQRERDASPDDEERKALDERLRALRRIAETLTLAEVSANERANDAQMRRLVYLLLCYEDGSQVIDAPDTQAGDQQFGLLPLPVVRAAKAATQEMLDAIERLPFASATASESTRDWLSAIIKPPSTLPV